MKLHLLTISVLALSVSACNPNYDNQSIASKQGENRAVTGGPDFKKWMIPEEDVVVISDPAPTSTTTTTRPVAKNPEAKPEAQVEKIPRSVALPNKLTLSGRLPISYPKEFTEAGTIKPTVYYIPLVNETEPSCKEEQMIPMISREGKELAKVCKKTFDGCALQGSCFVTNNKVSAILNHNGYYSGKHHFFEVDMEHCPFGQGIKSGCLDPFYTVAADLTLFKAGDVIYVPEVAGTLLPNGETHQGYFIVRDTGGVIDGAGRFDFFSGFSSWRDSNNPFAKLKLTDQSTKMKYFKVSGETADIVRKVRNFPGLPGF